MTATLYVDPSDPRPDVHEFATKYEKLYGHPPNFAAEISYSAAQLVVLALQKSGRDLTAEKTATTPSSRHVVAPGTR
jgi:ABC-type branched-subunit amino acid transport system substrate-binding protein